MISKLPRKYFRTLKLIGFICIFVTIGLTSISSTFATGHRATDDINQRRVVMISMPRLTWDKIQLAQTPNIDKIIAEGSVATLSVKVLGSRVSPSKGYATLSAGNRSTAVDPETSAFVSPSESYDGREVKETFESQRGKLSFKNPAALALGFELSVEANRKSLDKSKIGSFEKGLNQAKKTIAVFGNADQCFSSLPACYDRSVGYVGVNSNGVLKYGQVSRDLLVAKDKSSLPRPITNYETLTTNVKASIAKHDVTVGECSDLERLDVEFKKLTQEIYERDLKAAIEKCDTFIGAVLKSLDLSRDQIYVFSASSPRENEETTFFAAAGKSIKRGYASSSATRIKGAVTLVDIAPSILEFLGAPVPTSMNGSVLDWRASADSIQTRQDFLQSMNDRAVARDQTLKPTVWFLVFIFILSILLSLVVFTRQTSANAFAKILMLACAILPLMTFVAQPFMIWLAKPFRLITALAIASAALAVVLYVLAKKIGYAKVLLILSSIYLLVEIGDIVTGGRLQFNSIFGNATLVAGRFSGFNNQSFAILAVAMILFVAMVKQVTYNKNPKLTFRVNMALVGFMIFVLFIDGAPRFGSDVGGLLSLTPTIFVISMMIFEKRVGIKSLILSGVTTVGLVVAFALLDLARPAEKRTHLGRFAEQLLNGDAGLVIERKFVSALRSFTRIDVTTIAIVGIAYLLFLAFYDKGLLSAANKHFAGFKFLVYPGLFLCVLGTLVNDSGVTIPALMMLVGVPSVTLLVFESKDDEYKLAKLAPEKLKAK